MTWRTHKSTEGIGLDDVRGVVEPTEKEPTVLEPTPDEEFDSNTSKKIALGVGALGLMGIATAVAYRNLRKNHKEGN